VAPLTPAQRSLRSRLAAYEKWSKHDPIAGTAAARAAFDRRFDREVDPALELPIDERHRRADAAKKAYFTKLAFKSSRARAARRGGNDDA